MRKLFMLALLGLAWLALAGCGSQEAAGIPETAVSGPALIMFYTDN